MSDENVMKDKFASSIDKTDWRRTIHDCLEACIKSENTSEYPANVERCISAVACKYPGWDAFTVVNNKVNEVRKNWNAAAEKWVLEHPDRWAYPWDRMLKFNEFQQAMYKEIFDFLKNLTASKRMLLIGLKTTPSGTQMEVPDVPEE